MCYRHCVNCFAINGVCKFHADDDCDHEEVGVRVGEAGEGHKLFFAKNMV